MNKKIFRDRSEKKLSNLRNKYFFKQGEIVELHSKGGEFKL